MPTLANTKERHDVIYYLNKMTQSHRLLCVARVTRRGMKTYSESSIQQRNLQIWKKMLEKSNPLLQSKQPCVLKSLDVALNIARSWKNTLGKLAVAVNLEAFWIELNERSVSDGWNSCLLWSGILVGDSQISLIQVSQTHFSCNTVGLEQ